MPKKNAIANASDHSVANMRTREREYVKVGNTDPASLAVDVLIHGWEPGTSLPWMALADIHLGCLRDPMGLDNSLSRHRAAFAEFLAAVDAKKPKVVFIAGDIFHFKIVREQERALWANFVGQLLQRCIVIMQPGNHDFIVRGLSNLQNYQELFDHGVVPNLYMASNDPQFLRLTNGKDSVNVYNACCEVPVLLEGARWADVVMYHGAVKGSVYDNGFDPTTDPEYVDRRINLPYSEAAFWILGDIHLRQSPAKNAHYVGAILQTKFSEDAEKGYMEGEFSMTKAGRMSKTVQWRYRNLVTPEPLVTVVVPNGEGMPAEWPWGYLKLRYGTLITLPPDLPSTVIKMEMIGSTRYVNENEVDTSGMSIEEHGDFHLAEDTEEDIKALLKEQEEIELSEAEIQMASDEFFRISREVEG